MIQLKRRLIRSTCPYPYIDEDRVLHHGTFVKQPSACFACGKKTCADLYEHSYQPGPTQCDKGFSVFVTQFEGFRLIVNGLIVNRYHSKQPRKLKKMLKSQMTTEEQICHWYSECKALSLEVDQIIDDGINLSLGMLHDVKTAVSLIFRNAETLIDEEPGDTFDEKVDKASFNKKALFKSVSLLEERLKMMSLISNPEAATHGQKRPTPIYKVVDKIVKIFYPIANQRKIRLEIEGSSYNSPYLHESFSTIPLVLIDNAVKYSARGQTVSIRINDDRQSVSLEIESFSPKIEQDELDKIFEMHFRGKNACLVASSGSGLGLYLAKIVAEANAIQITHTELPGYPCKMNEIDHINNVFSFVA